MQRNGNEFGRVMADIIAMIENPAQFQERFDRVKENLENAREKHTAELNKIQEKIHTGEYDRIIEAEADRDAKVRAARVEMENAEEAYKSARLNTDVSHEENMRLWDALKDAKDAHYQERHRVLEEAFKRMHAPIMRAAAEIEKFGTELMQMQPAHYFLDINARIKMLESRTEELETYKSRTDHLWGSDLERVMPKKIGGHLPRWNLGRHRILLSASHDMDPNFMDDLITAKEEGRLSDEEYGRIWDTDIIIKATALNGAKEEVWVALEVSATVNDDDIERAAKSAELLQRIQERRALALVAGYSIGDPQVQQAEQAGVEVLLIR